MSQWMRHATVVALARRRSRVTGTYQDHYDAQRACDGEGYESAALIEVVLKKTMIYAQMLEQKRTFLTVDETGLVLNNALARALGDRINLSVLDFGGACGAHFYLARRMLGSKVALAWSVVETAAMVAAARSCHAPDELSFHETIESALRRLGTPDLVYANNSIQYSPTPMAALSDLLLVGSGHLCLSKMAIANLDSVGFTRQASKLSENGPGQRMSGNSDQLLYYPLALLPASVVQRKLINDCPTGLWYVHPKPLYHPSVGLVEYHSFLSSRAA